MDGLRRTATVAWRTPGLWSLGLLGFLVRGGLVVVLAPMLATPSPVGLSILIGPDLVDANGVSARVLGLASQAGAVVAAAAAGALLLAAVADLGGFEGLLANAGVAIQRPVGRAGARLIGSLMVLQVVAVVPAAVAAIPAAATVVDVTRREILLPSSQTAPLWWRVVEGASGSLLMVAALLMLAGYAYSFMSRELLGQRFGLITRRGWVSTLPGVAVVALGDALRRPWRMAVTSAMSWLVGLLAALLAAAAIGLGWAVTRTAVLAPTTPIDGGSALLAALAVAGAIVLLVSLMAVALVLLAATAAIRAAVLTQATMHGTRAFTAARD